MRYPLRRILLVLGGGEGNQPVLVWARRLARPRQPLITLLPLEAAERYPVGGAVTLLAQLLDLLEGAGPALRQTRALLPWFTEW